MPIFTARLPRIRPRDIGKPGGLGVDSGVEQCAQIAEIVRTCKGKMMLSFNDHPDIGRLSVNSTNNCATRLPVRLDSV